MTDQARKRAEEFATKWFERFNGTLESNAWKSKRDDFLAGHASALEDVGKVEVNGARRRTWSEYVDGDLGIGTYVNTEFIEAAPALLEIATLRAQLEKCKEQRDELVKEMPYEWSSLAEIESLDAELVQAKEL